MEGGDLAPLSYSAATAWPQWEIVNGPATFVPGWANRVPKPATRSGRSTGRPPMNETKSPDTTIAQYNVISKIGEGGMGEVYLDKPPLSASFGCRGRLLF